MKKYQLQEGSNGVFDAENNLSIPAAPGNMDWEDYQVWLAAGNVPDPCTVPAHTGSREIAEIQSRLAAYTQNTIVLNATGAGTITHGLGSLWYELTTTSTLTQVKTTNTVRVSGGTAGERISYSIRLLIPEDLNHLLTRNP